MSLVGPNEEFKVTTCTFFLKFDEDIKKVSTSTLSEEEVVRLFAEKYPSAKLISYHMEDKEFGVKNVKIEDFTTIYDGAIVEGKADVSEDLKKELAQMKQKLNTYENNGQNSTDSFPFGAFVCPDAQPPGRRQSNPLKFININKVTTPQQLAPYFPFVGREEEVEALHDHLINEGKKFEGYQNIKKSGATVEASKNVVVTCIDGAPGIGKTTFGVKAPFLGDNDAKSKRESKNESKESKSDDGRMLVLRTAFDTVERSTEFLQPAYSIALRLLYASQQLDTSWSDFWNKYKHYKVTLGEVLKFLNPDKTALFLIHLDETNVLATNGITYLGDVLKALQDQWNAGFFVSTILVGTDHVVNKAGLFASNSLSPFNIVLPMMKRSEVSQILDYFDGKLSVTDSSTSAPAPASNSSSSASSSVRHSLRQATLVRDKQAQAKRKAEEQRVQLLEESPISYLLDVLGGVPRYVEWLVFELGTRGVIEQLSNFDSAVYKNNLQRLRDDTTFKFVKVLLSELQNHLRKRHAYQKSWNKMSSILSDILHVTLFGRSVTPDHEFGEKLQSWSLSQLQSAGAVFRVPEAAHQQKKTKTETYQLTMPAFNLKEFIFLSPDFKGHNSPTVKHLLNWDLSLSPNANERLSIEVLALRAFLLWKHGNKISDTTVNIDGGALIPGLKGDILMPLPMNFKVQELPKQLSAGEISTLSPGFYKNAKGAPAADTFAVFNSLIVLLQEKQSIAARKKVLNGKEKQKGAQFPISKEDGFVVEYKKATVGISKPAVFIYLTDAVQPPDFVKHPDVHSIIQQVAKGDPRYFIFDGSSGKPQSNSEFFGPFLCQWRLHSLVEG